MKFTTTLPAAFIGIALAFGFTACSDHGHDHADGDGEHGDADQEEHAEDDHKNESAEEHAEHAGEHEKKTPGPNGGRLITSVEPHLEFLITDDRKVRISAVDDDIKVVPVGTQTVSIIAGDRANPTRLAFAADGASLLSDVALPEGNDFPLVLQIKASPDAETVREKFNANFSDCPSCDYEEYACICGHDEGDHDHEEHKKE